MCNHLATFVGHWSSAKGDMKYLIYHVTSQNHVIEGSTNFMSCSSSWYVIVTTLFSLVVIGIVVIVVYF